MHVLITGGTGFIGSALIPQLLSRGDSVTVLTRQTRSNQKNLCYVNELDHVDQPVDAVINLAGASLAAKRWSASYKAEMVESRVNFTERLVQWLGRQAQIPKVLISGSAIGFYGCSLEQRFTEDFPGGAGFAATLCQAWESAAHVVESESTRLVLLRLGVVFDRDGGALQEMIRSFRLGVGSWVGRGDQWLSWIHRADVVGIILMALDNKAVSGVLNAVAPNPVTHREFCDTLARQKPVVFKLGVPGAVLRLLLGEMADELLLQGQYVDPQALSAVGYNFKFPSLESALTDIVSR